MRHAIYFTPDPLGMLHRLGSQWLGRDAVNWKTLSEQPDARLAELTTDARRYGFHGTLKPPFRLKDGTTFSSFEVAARRISSQHVAFATTNLALKVIDGFLALAPETDCEALDHLAADCVRHLDDFRKAAGEAELLRRRAVGLTDRQDAHLIRWGYPYVFDDLRFHMTLTRRLTDEERAWVWPLAQAHFAAVLGQPLHVDAISLVTEPSDNADFMVEQRLPLVLSNVRAA
jgi:putative phosphonate metabolism protein